MLPHEPSSRRKSLSSKSTTTTSAILDRLRRSQRGITWFESSEKISKPWTILTLQTSPSTRLWAWTSWSCTKSSSTRNWSPEWMRQPSSFNELSAIMSFDLSITLRPRFERQLRYCCSRNGKKPSSPSKEHSWGSENKTLLLVWFRNLWEGSSRSGSMT